jgi:hypothetical protein
MEVMHNHPRKLKIVRTLKRIILTVQRAGILRVTLDPVFSHPALSRLGFLE